MTFEIPIKIIPDDPKDEKVAKQLAALINMEQKNKTFYAITGITWEEQLFLNKMKSKAIDEMEKRRWPTTTT